MKVKTVSVVGDFGITGIEPATLAAYGIKSYPINRRSSTQRKRLQKLERNVAAMQEHAWLTGKQLDKA